MTPTPYHWTAARRVQAWRRKPQDWPPRQSAAALGGREAAVSPWVPRVREGGGPAVRPRRRPELRDAVTRVRRQLRLIHGCCRRAKREGFMHGSVTDVSLGLRGIRKSARIQPTSGDDGFWG